VSTVPKQIARLALGLPLLYGLLPVAVVWVSLPRWDAFSMSIIAFVVMFAVGGIVMLSSLLWLLGTMGRARTPLWAGGIASLANAALFAFFTLTDILPCSGPD
jgi:RsiW-degrading membrane proteinase PrsW (M82 family)